MCGIFGYFDQQKQSMPEPIFMSMGKAIEHRGPDGRGIYHSPSHGIGIGNQRLAIIDVKGGNQPFSSDDQTIFVVQNGEIFNHVELAESLANRGHPCKTHSDTETILRLYEADGIEGISQLNGMFAIAIYDARLDKLFLIRDRLGEKPLYFAHDNHRLLFGSEIKSILHARESKPEIDHIALEQFFAFNYMPKPRTLFQGISHVEPGTYLEISRESICSHRWWDLSQTKVAQKSETAWIDDFMSILDDSVRIRLRADVPFGAFLSGGVDSSTVVGLMSKHLDRPVKTYSIGFDDPRYDESPFAQAAADRFKTEHHLEIVQPNLTNLWPMATYHSDQPHGDISFLPTYRVAELAAREVKMVLTGDGADELFAGYDKYAHFFARPELTGASFHRAYAENISLFSSSQLEQLFSKPLSKPATAVFADTLEPLFKESQHLDQISQALYIDAQLLLSGNNLVKPDRMGMAVSIENRAPFLDYRMIELAFSMPGTLKLRDGETKYLYKKAVTPLIGEDLAYRKKQMFTVPVGEWFKTDLREMAEDLLLSERTRSRELFNYHFVQSLIEQHLDGSTNHTREIRALMAFEIWARQFIDEEVYRG